jgi:hypothetical protein
MTPDERARAVCEAMVHDEPFLNEEPFEEWAAPQVARAIRAAEEEREACARVVEGTEAVGIWVEDFPALAEFLPDVGRTLSLAADAIRARGGETA